MRYEPAQDILKTKKNTISFKRKQQLMKILERGFFYQKGAAFIIFPDVLIKSSAYASWLHKV